MKKLKILAIVCVLVMTTNVHAALQSRPGVDAANESISYFYKPIREMEAQGGALGLSANFELNSETGEYEEITSVNNIDPHMCKNTEWGAVMMLSASNYGTGNGNMKHDYNSTSMTYGVTASTTGNMTGVFGMKSGDLSYEFLAAGIIEQCSILKNERVRYYDSYAASTDPTDFSRYIPGDATYEMKSFSNLGEFVTNDKYYFYRNGFAAGRSYSTHWVALSGSRACVWVGDGI